MLIRLAGQADLQGIREIFREYGAWVGNHICFVSFEKELAELPGAYAVPGGGLYLAEGDQEIAGCGAFRMLTPDCAEMKRLYVRPEYRGKGLGPALGLRIVEDARRAGYERLRLDTLPRMERAIEMYRGLGFQAIPAYVNSTAEALCFELALT